ncbi:MAG TPA: S-adenosylmethionine decarboxylase [bacterium]|nr:S-adenosylmethionine decarboxylase [bacterium]
MAEPSSRKHVLVDWWIRDVQWLEHSGPMRTELISATQLFGFNVVHDHFHDFDPVGYTGFLLLSESHLSVHSWTDEGYLALDIFSCRTGNLSALVEYLRNRLSPYRECFLERPRGVIERLGGRNR